jgi:hypothetical protein
VEYVDCETLAQILNVPETWLRDQTRSRADDPIPCTRFGRYVRFQPADPDLMAWLERRKSPRKKV